jgi:hypothetical protein
MFFAGACNQFLRIGLMDPWSVLSLAVSLTCLTGLLVDSNTGLKTDRTLARTGNIITLGYNEAADASKTVV